MYKIFYSKQAIKVLRKMPRNWANRIIKKIDELAVDPFLNRQVKSLRGSETCRLRVGDWRVVYSINSNQLEIWIVKVAPRGEVYKS